VKSRMRTPESAIGLPGPAGASLTGATIV
jgi:hypothetical protein